MFEKKQCSRLFAECVSCVLFISALFFIQNVYAQESVQHIDIDAATRKKGYTASFDQRNFFIIVPPQSLLIDATLTIKKHRDDDSALSVSLPEYYELASPVYQYDFGELYPKDFRKGISIHIRSENLKTKLAFYDRTREKWNMLPTLRSKQGTAFASLGLAYARIALLREKSWRLNSHIVSAAIPARSVFVADDREHRYVAKAIHQKLPIASITKLMTALVFLENNPGWSKNITIRSTDHADSSRVNFGPGETVRVRDLFESMLIGSKNDAAKALARSTGLSTHEFVTRMNRKAVELGLDQTHFVDTTGLSAQNMSSAAEVGKLARVAFAKKDIQRATAKAKLSFQAQNTRRRFTVRTTNAMLGNGIPIKAAKTGFIQESGYNFVMETVRGGKRVFVVILGAHDADSRFRIAEELIRSINDRSAH